MNRIWRLLGNIIIFGTLLPPQVARSNDFSPPIELLSDEDGWIVEISSSRIDLNEATLLVRYIRYANERIPYGSEDFYLNEVPVHEHESLQYVQIDLEEVFNRASAAVQVP